MDQFFHLLNRIGIHAAQHQAVVLRQNGNEHDSGCIQEFIDLQIGLGIFSAHRDLGFKRIRVDFRRIGLRDASGFVSSVVARRFLVLVVIILTAR